jgi:hypothetical protein
MHIQLIFGIIQAIQFTPPAIARTD